MPQSLLEVLHRRSGRRSQALTRVPQIVKRNLDADAIPRPDERLVDRVTSHPLAVPTHTEELRTGEVSGVLAQQRQDVWWHIDDPLARLALRVLLVLLGRLQKFDPVLRYPNQSGIQVDVRCSNGADLPATQTTPCREDHGGPISRSDLLEQFGHLLRRGNLPLGHLHSAGPRNLTRIAQDRLILNSEVQHRAHETVRLTDRGAATLAPQCFRVPGANYRGSDC